MADTCSTADCKGKLTGQSALWGIEDTVSNIILEAVPLFRPFICHKFYIQLALPISPETMDRFWCSRCLNDRIKVLNMMRLFVGRATTPLVVKIWTKHPWVKIENSRNFDRNFVLFRGKIWLWLFYNLFCVTVLRFYTENLKSFWLKMKAWQWFFQILISFWIGKINFCSKWLEIFCVES